MTWNSAIYGSLELFAKRDALEVNEASMWTDKNGLLESVSDKMNRFPQLE